MTASFVAYFLHWLDYTLAFSPRTGETASGTFFWNKRNQTCGTDVFSLYEVLRSGLCFEAILLQRHVLRLSSACGWTGSGSLKGWAWAAVKQRDQGRQRCQRGPCVLLWTSTVGPPSGWVPQPGPMRLTAHLFETRKFVLLLLTFAK